MKIKRTSKWPGLPHRGSYGIACNNHYILLSDEVEHLENCSGKKLRKAETQWGRMGNPEFVWQVYTSRGYAGPLLAPEALLS